jgi:metal-dependent HD superfamily phosphatase/phosphodiesterase
MITYECVRRNPDIRALIEAGNSALGVLGFTDHGFAHVEMTSKTAAAILETLGFDGRTCELARIAGYMHDIGNAVNRSDHAMSGALLAFDQLRGMGADTKEAIAVMTAIGNHDEGTATAVTPLCAALILADKSDVRRSRVRAKQEDFDIHDRVNYAVEDSSLTVLKDEGIISLGLQIDTSICPVMDYFAIFLTRMKLCKAAADFLGMNFELVINETRML